MSIRLKSSKGTRTVPTTEDLQPQELGNVSLNDIRTPGAYYFTASSGVTGCEYATTGSVHVIRNGAGTYTQVVGTGAHFYLRTYSSGTWGAWRVIRSEVYSS